MIVKKKYGFLYKLFLENEFDIKGIYKPIYYALLHFMEDEDERKRMGPELKETVDEIIETIKQFGIDYK